MFVGFRMRVLQLSKGTGNPQDWVRMSMQAVTYSILANTLLVLLVPLFTSKEIKTTKEGDLDPEGTSPFEVVMLRAADTLAMAPMLCVLFLAARMRALQMDPVGGNPQRWAQRCFYAASYCLIAQTMMAAIVPLCLKAKALPKDDKTVEGDVKYEFEG